MTKYGAVRTHVLEFCHALSKTEDVTLLSQATPNTIAPHSNFQVHQVKPISSRPNNLGDILSTIKMFFYLVRKYNAHKPDIMYVRATALGLGPLMYARFVNIPSLLEINGAWSEEQNY